MPETTTTPRPSTESVEQTLRRLIAAAATDAALHRRLKDDPAAALGEAGLTVPDGVRVTVEETTPEQAAAVAARSTDDHLVLPLPRRPEGELSDSDLDAVSGGGPLDGLLAAVALPFNLMARWSNSNSDRFVSTHAQDLAADVARKWNDSKTV